MEQVLVNLAANARDAMPGGGQLLVRVADQAAAGRVLLTVRDNGCGMDAATRARIFDAFYTTKPAGAGTGLGLTTVQDIVHQAGGDIEVDSAPGRGTSFTIALPRAPEALAPAATVLLVEGDGAARDEARDALVRAGYRVLEAEDGVAALTLAARWTGRIDLVVCEALPGWLAGGELAQRLCESRPGLAVLLLGGEAASGYAQPPVGDAARLREPFSADRLVRSVHEVLRSRAAVRTPA
jgi:two-component system, cell cycle sensor histidine kinase and response regulator CckA